MISWLFRDNGDLSKEEIRKVKSFSQYLGYSFKKLIHLKRALTHKSHANEGRKAYHEHNERYEFLGDAVLELAISDLMMHQFPDSTEGDLSKLRAALVNEKSLAEIARKINLGRYLYLGRGEDQGLGREKDSLLADAFEGVLGAVYLDGGFKPAFKIVKVLFNPYLSKAQDVDISKDYKTKLQEESQNQFQTIPHYQLVKQSGPDHDKTFEIKLHIRGEIYGAGTGKSKKQAEQMAALEALKKMGKV